MSDSTFTCATLLTCLSALAPIAPVSIELIFMMPALVIAERESPKDARVFVRACIYIYIYICERELQHLTLSPLLA